TSASPDSASNTKLRCLESSPGGNAGGFVLDRAPRGSRRARREDRRARGGGTYGRERGRERDVSGSRLGHFVGQGAADRCRSARRRGGLGRLVDFAAAPALERAEPRRLDRRRRGGRRGGPPPRAGRFR